MAEALSRDEFISKFIDMTGSTSDVAINYGGAANWDVHSAVASWYTDQDELQGIDTTGEPEEDGPDETDELVPIAQRREMAARENMPYTGPRTLDGRPAPNAGASSSKKPVKKTGLATLSSLGGGSRHHHDDGDDDDDDGRGDLYAGGEKSGLSVQDPKQGGGPSSAKRVIDDIMKRAKANAERPPAADQSSEAGPSRPTHFRGTGQTLGGDGAPSRTIPDPRGEPIPRSQAQASNGPPQEQRALHIWADGFSIDDGPLYRFDDPNNAAYLDMIQQGRAPTQLLNVRYDQPVDITLARHNENWHQLPKLYRPFGGEGRRLGSPVPGDGSGAAVSSEPAPASNLATSTSVNEQASTVNDSQPTVTIRIQMPDGSRLPARFNTTQTIGDVYNFIECSSPALRSGGWVLATTFPNKNHTESTLALSDVPEFQRGGTAVVKRI